MKQYLVIALVMTISALHTHAQERTLGYGYFNTEYRNKFVVTNTQGEITSFDGEGFKQTIYNALVKNDPTGFNQVDDFPFEEIQANLLHKLTYLIRGKSEQDMTAEEVAPYIAKLQFKKVDKSFWKQNGYGLAWIMPVGQNDQGYKLRIWDPLRSDVIAYLPGSPTDGLFASIRCANTVYNDGTRTTTVTTKTPPQAPELEKDFGGKNGSTGNISSSTATVHVTVPTASVATTAPAPVMLQPIINIQLPANYAQPAVATMPVAPAPIPLVDRTLQDRNYPRDRDYRDDSREIVVRQKANGWQIASTIISGLDLAVGVWGLVNDGKQMNMLREIRDGQLNQPVVQNPNNPITQLPPYSDNRYSNTWPSNQGQGAQQLVDPFGSGRGTSYSGYTSSGQMQFQGPSGYYPNNAGNGYNNTPLNPGGNYNNGAVNQNPILYTNGLGNGSWQYNNSTLNQGGSGNYNNYGSYNNGFVNQNQVLYTNGLGGGQQYSNGTVRQYNNTALNAQGSSGSYGNTYNTGSLGGSSNQGSNVSGFNNTSLSGSNTSTSTNSNGW